LSLAVANYQPMLSFAAMADQNGGFMQMSANGDHDCSDMPTDCCDDDGDRSKSMCRADAACAARCHVNISIEPAPFSSMVIIYIPAEAPTSSQQDLFSRDPALILRPPIA